MTSNLILYTFYFEMNTVSIIFIRKVEKLVEECRPANFRGLFGKTDRHFAFYINEFHNSILSPLVSICSCVKPLATTHSLIWLNLGNYEIHSHTKKCLSPSILY